MTPSKTKVQCMRSRMAGTAPRRCLLRTQGCPQTLMLTANRCLQVQMLVRCLNLQTARHRSYTCGPRLGNPGPLAAGHAAQRLAALALVVCHKRHALATPRKLGAPAGARPAECGARRQHRCQACRSAGKCHTKWPVPHQQDMWRAAPVTRCFAQAARPDRHLLGSTQPLRGAALPGLLHIPSVFSEPRPFKTH